MERKLHFIQGLVHCLQRALEAQGISPSASETYPATDVEAAIEAMTGVSKNFTATSQQSRFHSETLETCCEDVDLKNVNLLVGDQELLADAALRLFSGVHYGLIGANGVGKCAAWCWSPPAECRS